MATHRIGRAPARAVLAISVVLGSCGGPQTGAAPPASAGRGARDPLLVDVIVGSEGKGMYVGAGVPPDNMPIYAAKDGAVPAGVTPLAHDIFSTRDFYADRDLWTDPRCYRCNSPVGLEQIWGAYEYPLIGDDPPRTAAWGFCDGLSTGVYHAATYVFRPELWLPGTARPAGAILLSGPYSFDFAAPSKGERVYFGEDPKRWPEMVIPGHVSRGDIPVLFTTAEWDNARYLWPQAAVYQELIEKHKARPRYRQSLGHNHSSQLLSVGTPDTSVSRELVDFIERTARR